MNEESDGLCLDIFFVIIILLSENFGDMNKRIIPGYIQGNAEYFPSGE